MPHAMVLLDCHHARPRHDSAPYSKSRKLKLKLFTTFTVRTGCCLKALPAMLFRKLTSQGSTVNRRNPTSPKGVGGFLPPPGECALRSGGRVQLGACGGAECGGAACGRAGFDAVYEKEMMQPLDNVCVELCDDA
jgi:hypothetical protein